MRKCCVIAQQLLLVRQILEYTHVGDAARPCDRSAKHLRHCLNRRSQKSVRQQARNYPMGGIHRHAGASRHSMPGHGRAGSE